MADEDLIYMPGDTIEFSVEVDHDFNIGDAYAVFLRREPEGSNPFPLLLKPRTIEGVERTGTKMVSRITFVLTLDQGNHVPGDYDLEGVNATPVGAGRSTAKKGVDLGSPEVSFTIAPVPTEPSGRVRFWGIGFKSG